MLILRSLLMGVVLSRSSSTDTSAFVIDDVVLSFYGVTPRTPVQIGYSLAIRYSLAEAELERLGM